MELKVCSCCRERKPLDQFHVRTRSRDGRQSRCKTCKAQSHKDYYVSEPEKWARYKKEKRERLWEWFGEVKSQPCTDCGNKYPACVMEFDHREGDQKLGNIGAMLMAASRAKLEAEIAKCDLVCANCHRLRTCQRSKNHTHAPLV